MRRRTRRISDADACPPQPATSTLPPYWTFWFDTTRSKTMVSVLASVRIW
jgi:hypothetical protein